MQRLKVQLLLALKIDKTHGRTRCSFGNTLSVPVVIFLGLYIWANVFRRHQPNLMTLCRKQPAQMMGTAACFHCNHADWKLRHVINQRLAAHRPTSDNSTGRVDTNYAARVLAQINSKDHYSHWPVPFFLTHDSIIIDAGERGGPFHKRYSETVFRTLQHNPRQWRSVSLKASRRGRIGWPGLSPNPTTR